MTGLGDLLGLMRDFGAMKKRLAEVQEDLAARTVGGSAGGGQVVVTVNGRQELVDLRIDPAAVAVGDAGRLEELVKGAVGEAMAKARDLQREGLSKVLGGTPLPPGLEGLIG